MVVVIVGAVATVALKRREVAVAGPSAVVSLKPLDANASTYELFQQGSAFFERYDKEENLNGAMQDFQNALAKDPNY